MEKESYIVIAASFKKCQKFETEWIFCQTGT